ncbi:unnamed protein product [Ilex paraguariensis]|uniref:Uncharacterized protein n=1 Tax=Ilex paraguariensis TaxID=185542 RepID=A0ABC8RE20_9AQUA
MELAKNVGDGVFGGLHLVSGLHIVRGPAVVFEDDGLHIVCSPTGAIGLHIVCGLAGPTGVVEDSVSGLSGILGVDRVANGDVSLFLLT